MGLISTGDIILVYLRYMPYLSTLVQQMKIIPALHRRQLILYFNFYRLKLVPQGNILGITLILNILIYYQALENILFISKFEMYNIAYYD